MTMAANADTAFHMPLKGGDNIAPRQPHGLQTFNDKTDHHSGSADQCLGAIVLNFHPIEQRGDQSNATVPFITGLVNC